MDSGTTHMPFSPSVPLYPPMGDRNGSAAHQNGHNGVVSTSLYPPPPLSGHSYQHPSPHHFFPDTSTSSFPYRHPDVHHEDNVERGRTGPTLPGQTIKHLGHPYSRSPSRNPASRDSSVNREAGSAGTGASTPPRSGRAGVKRRQKYSRTRTGCLCCRARRIKCDEERPVCRRCVIAKKQCQYPDEGSASVSRGNSREDTERGAGGSRSNTDEPAEDRSHPSAGQPQYVSISQEAHDIFVSIHSRALEEANKTSACIRKSNFCKSNLRYELSEDEDEEDEDEKRESLAKSRPPYHDPFKLALPPYAKQGGIVDPADYNFDQSFVGSYGDSGSTNVLGPTSTIPENVDGVQEGNITVAGIQQKYALAGSAPMLATPNFLLPWFPTQEERSLILHYCANAADLMMAIPSGLNPMLAINLPLALDSPRGTNPAADALRVALLGIGAIHQAFLLARSGVSTTQTTAMFQYASNLRDMGKELVRRSLADPNCSRSDAALGAATALSTIDIFFGGEGWMDNFNVAKEMVAYRGGPAAMLKASKPKQLAEGVTISPARLMLEILAIYDVFGSLALGEEPTFLSEGNDSWWFEGSQSTYEEHSVEKQFGMSRVMVHLFSRLTILLARVYQSDILITESDEPGTMTLPGSTNGEQPPTPTTAWLSAMMKPQESSDPLVIEARKLNADVDAWIDSLQLSTLEHERVQVGNRAYAFAMKILLLRRVFKYPREDLRVQNAASEVLRHCSTSTAILGMSIDLMWPAIIAGCCVDGDARQWLLTLLEGFKSQCCFDVETASRIVQESWRRVDVKDPRDDWKEICEDFGLKVLLC